MGGGTSNAETKSDDEEENTKMDREIDVDDDDDDVSTKRSTDETGIMPSVALSILRMQGLFQMDTVS